VFSKGFPTPNMKKKIISDILWRTKDIVYQTSHSNGNPPPLNECTFGKGSYLRRGVFLLQRTVWLNKNNWFRNTKKKKNRAKANKTQQKFIPVRLPSLKQKPSETIEFEWSWSSEGELWLWVRCDFPPFSAALPAQLCAL